MLSRKKFIKPLKKTIELTRKLIMPPAAILAIAGVESGFGRGYVASISGNILSQGTNKGKRNCFLSFYRTSKSHS